MAGRAIGVVSTLHFLLGLILCAMGVTWICLHFLQDNFAHESLPDTAFLVMCPEIICGFFVLVTGFFGFCMNDKFGCAGCLFVMGNVFNIIVWLPILVAGYAFLILTIYRNSNGDLAMCGQDPCLPTNWDNYNLTYLIQDDKQWVYSFPGVGIAAGFVDFIVSISALVAFCSLRNKYEKETAEKD